MGLFTGYHISRSAIEHKLKRPLTGDASRGEVALVYRLNNDRLTEVAETLRRPDQSLKPDFVEYLREHVAAAGKDTDRPRKWSVTVSAEAARFYAERAALAHVPIQVILEEVIARDHQNSLEALSVVDSLAQAVHTTNTSLQATTTELKGVVAKVGDIQQIGLRIHRIEQVLSAQAKGMVPQR